MRAREVGEDFAAYKAARLIDNAKRPTATVLYASADHQVNTPDGVKGVPYVKPVKAPELVAA